MEDYFFNLVIGNLANLDIKALKKKWPETSAVWAVDGYSNGGNLLQEVTGALPEQPTSMQKFHVELKDLDIPTKKIFRWIHI